MYRKFDEAEVPLVKKALAGAKLDMEGRHEQLSEIFDALKLIRNPENRTHLFKYSQCGHGKTANLQIIAWVMGFQKEFTVILLVPNNFLLARMSEDLAAANAKFTPYLKVFEPGQTDP